MAAAHGKGLGGPGVLVGRETELGKLKELYKQIHPPVVLIIGPQGSGKTKLTTEFGLQQRTLFLRLNGHNLDVLRFTVTQVADALGVRTTDFTWEKPSDDDTASRRVRHRQRAISAIATDVLEANKAKSGSSSKRAVLVVDNVNEFGTLKAILGSLTHAETIRANCLVIINTIHNHGPQYGTEEPLMHIVPLALLDLEGGKLLIRGVLNDFSPAIESAVDPLAAWLHGLPLPLQTTCAYIKSTKCTILECLEVYKERRSQEESNPFAALLQEADPGVLATKVVWETSLKCIRDEEKMMALEILRICAYAIPEQIPYNFLAYFLQGEYSLEQFEKVIAQLCELALLDGDNHACRIHRSFQAFLRAEMRNAGQEADFLTKWLRIVNTVAEQLSSLSMLHAISLLDHASQHEEILEEFASLPDKIADRLYALEMYEEMLAFSMDYSAKLAVCSHLGPEHLQTLTMEAQVGFALWLVGTDDERALAKLQAVQRRCETFLGDRHELCRVVSSLLGLAEQNHGRVWEERDLDVQQDSDFMGQQLFEMHHRLSMSPDPPFWYETDVGGRPLKRRDFPGKVKDPTVFQGLVTACMETFNRNRGGLGLGSVDHNPHVWVEIAVERIKAAVENGSGEVLRVIKFPNGCCTQKGCAINKMYEAVVDEYFGGP